MQRNLKPIVHEILSGYPLPINGYHGLGHWARVLENGIRLAAVTKANLAVVSLFAVLHDSRRQNECHDPDHGLRGAELAVELRGRLFELSDDELSLLFLACEGHTRERTHSDITIQTCWDSDRLDLGRVGVTPHPKWLSTAAAKSKEMISWADGRSRFHVVPDFVAGEWGIVVDDDRSPGPFKRP